MTGPEVYTALGWRVFPCHRILAEGECSCGVVNCGSPGKHPATTRGCRDGSTDPGKFRWTDRNVAVCTGDGLHVIDVDAKAGARLEHTDDGWLLIDGAGNHVTELPPSRVHRTGGGGWHWYGAVSERLRNSSGTGKQRSLGLGIDSRGEGGYVLAPPSNHVSGDEYEVLDARELAPVPESVLAVLRDPVPGAAPAPSVPRQPATVPTGYVARALADECRIVASVPESAHNLNNTLNTAALKLGQLVGAGLLERITVENELLAAAVGNGHPEREARATIRSGLEAGLKQPRQVPERVRPATAHVEVIPQENWRAMLLKDRSGEIPCPDNAIVTLQHHPFWHGCVAWDEFESRIVWRRDAPKLELSLTPPRAGDVHQDHHSAYVQAWLGQEYRRPFSLLSTHQAIETCAAHRRIHPLRDWLTSLRWDGHPRVSGWLSTYLNADESPYVDKVGRWWLISAVARVMQPGCQVDHMLVLEGAQGTGKTAAARILAGEYYLGDLPDVRDQKAAAESLAGSWIVEIGELDSIRGAALTRVKMFLSHRKDRFRPAYARTSVTRPRQCVFIGTTNEDAYLADPTGARRFWPVKVGQLHRDDLTSNRDQLWAEALHLYRQGETWHPDRADVPELAEQQEQRYQADEYESLIAEWGRGKFDKFEIRDVLHECLGLDKSKWDRATQTRVGIALHRLGFQWDKKIKDGRRVRMYFWPTYRG